MPIGKKVGKYCILDDQSGLGFRKMAEIMTNNGYKMGHATARGVLLKSMKKIAKHVLVHVADNDKPSEQQLNDLITNPYFHSAIGDVINVIEDNT